MGIGVASGFKNVGAGKGKVDDAGAIFSLQPDGRILVRASAVEMGQGIRTALLQIAGEVLRLPADAFRPDHGRHGPHHPPRRRGGRTADPDRRPGDGTCRLPVRRSRADPGRRIDGPASDRSSNLMVRPSAPSPGRRSHPGGPRRAARPPGRGTRGHLLPRGSDHICPGRRGSPPLRTAGGVPQLSGLRLRHAGRHRGGGEATGKVRVLKIIAAHDCGRAINPQKIEGQIEGSCLQGLGYALSEAYRLENGPAGDAHLPSARRAQHPRHARRSR